MNEKINKDFGGGEDLSVEQLAEESFNRHNKEAEDFLIEKGIDKGEAHAPVLIIGEGLSEEFESWKEAKKGGEV